MAISYFERFYTWDGIECPRREINGLEKVLLIH